MKPLKSTLLSLLLLPSIAAASSLTVIKSPTCGCCDKWIEKLPDKYNVTIEHPGNIAAIKAELGIPAAGSSCHTAVHESGLFFEGHIPTGLMDSYLAGKRSQNGIGLTVPKMPIGSPGMEHGGRFQAYRVYELLSNGKAKIYAEVASKAEQDSMME